MLAVLGHHQHIGETGDQPLLVGMDRQPQEEHYRLLVFLHLMYIVFLLVKECLLVMGWVHHQQDLHLGAVHCRQGHQPRRLSSNNGSRLLVPQTTCRSRAKKKRGAHLKIRSSEVGADTENIAVATRKRNGNIVAIAVRGAVAVGMKLRAL